MRDLNLKKLNKKFLCSFKVFNEKFFLMCANLSKFLSMMELTSQFYFTFEMKDDPGRIKGERFELEHTANLEISACFVDLSEKKGICPF